MKKKEEDASKILALDDMMTTRESCQKERADMHKVILSDKDIFFRLG